MKERKRSKEVKEKKSTTTRKRIGHFFLGIIYFVIGVGIAFGFVVLAYIYIGKPAIQKHIESLASTEEILYLGEERDFEPENWLVNRFVTTMSNVNPYKVGEYHVLYEVYEGASYEKKVRVIDRTPPVVKLIGNENSLIGSLSTWKDPGAIAIDDSDGDISDQIESEVVQVDDNHYDVVYTVRDWSGYERKARRHVELTQNVVCLTFDDGPSTEISNQILDILSNYDVKASFFVLGFDDSKANIIARELNEGHTVGLHGYSHEWNEIYTSKEALVDNYVALDTLIKTKVDENYYFEFLRFPGGTSNTISKKYCKGIMTDAAELFADSYVDWNIDSEDAAGANKDEIVQNVTSNLQPGRTNVVLMHDSVNKQDTVDALPEIIEWCLANGYVFEPLNSELDLASAKHKPQN